MKKNTTQHPSLSLPPTASAAAEPDAALASLVAALLAHLRDHYEVGRLLAAAAAPAKASDREEPLSAAAEAREAALRALRTARARERNVPPYFIFTNRTLREIARKAPTSLEGLGEIHGLGPRRIAELGQAVLDALPPARAVASARASTRHRASVKKRLTSSARGSRKA